MGSLKFRLQTLTINLVKEEEVEYLIKCLKNLRELNGLKVDRDELEIEGSPERPKTQFESQ